ncbi:MAG: helix-turn-helix transcriptional regulator [Holophaga sp.]|nr:helix-turn-helix transcriptional regulator [Holophaga sp.]
MKRKENNLEVAPVLNSLGDRIKAVRVNWAWSQEEMAATLRVDQASISFWERDKIKPSGSAMVALAALFRTSLKALETGEGFILPAPPSCLPDGKNSKREIPRSVSLPAEEKDLIAIVDLADGSSKGKPVSEAMMILVQSAKEGRKVWVVIE